ncbi:MAG: hypothetical protein M3512_03075 [Bacteroidota bacterium]|nr:hypothetical protein [Bacteroidota bacterium]
MQLIEILDVPVYQIRYFTTEQNTEHGAHPIIKTHLAHAETGIPRSPITENEAILIAKQKIKGYPEVEKIAYLESVGAHHEYREKTLPAWAITFSGKNKVTVYIASELGTFQSIRHNQWRIFDFLWMLHTMDYQGRDNIGNILLKVFSLVGLITILSGFTLYLISSPTWRRWFGKRKKQYN